MGGQQVKANIALWKRKILHDENMGFFIEMKK
jgi:hypothetical protein